MKRTLLLFFLTIVFATSTANASLWSWSFDELAGTFSTNETGYDPGAYTLDVFTIVTNGTSNVPLGSTGNGVWNEAINASYTFEWDGANASLLAAGGFGAWIFIADSVADGAGASLVQLSDEDVSLWATDNGTNNQSGLGRLNIAPVPVPAAVWLFGSAVLGLVGMSRRNRS